MRGLVALSEIPPELDFAKRDFRLKQFRHLMHALVEINCFIELAPLDSDGRKLAECARRDLGRASQAIVEAK
jgi:hypothetical protein